MTIITVATCNLNQWAMDFTTNYKNILKSCEVAKEKGATYRLGPELEICGYGCEDHFNEPDTISHSWEMLAKLLSNGASDGLLCDFGMPVLHHSVLYNCRAICYNRQILLVRPKMALADDGNYREGRWFTRYRGNSVNAKSSNSSSDNSLEHVFLPESFTSNISYGTHPPQSSSYAPFGFAAITSTDGISIGSETCEELWTPQSPHITMSLSGVDIIGNGSGSHHELRKLNTR